MQKTIKNSDTIWVTLPKRCTSPDYVNTLKPEFHISNFKINKSTILKKLPISNYKMIKTIKILTNRNILLK